MSCGWQYPSLEDLFFEKGLSILGIGLRILGVSLFGVLFVNALQARGGDFDVFWSAARHWVAGQPLYDFARDGVECFKYPPWIAPFLAPLAFFSITTAGVLWRLGMLYALWSIYRTCSRELKNPTLALALLIPFWGFWMANVVGGQMMIYLLACAIWGFSRLPTQRGWLLMWSALSAKVFHLFAFIAVSKNSLKNTQTPCYHGLVKSASALFFGALVLSLPAFWAYPHWSDWLPAFLKTASSGNQNLGGGMYGIPAVMVRMFGALTGQSVESSNARLIAWIPSALIAATFFVFFKKRRGHEFENSPIRAFSVALGLSAAIHPLVFSVTFCWVYPLAVFAVDDVFLRGKKHPFSQWLVGFGLVSVTLLNSKLESALGFETLSNILSFFSIKAIGVFLIVLGYSLGGNSIQNRNLSQGRR